jgi:sugar/nucleoside kinase (ribokinase family)
MNFKDASQAGSYDLFAIGEALVDLISTEMAENLGMATHFQRFPGGQVENLAMNMARLGKRTALAASVGEDGFGHYIQEQLELGNVTRDYIQTTSKATTTISIITRHTQTPDFVIFRGADIYLRLTPEIKSAVSSCRLVHTSAFALSREPARSTIIQVLKIARENGSLVSLDPNYHSNIWPDVPNYTDILQEFFRLVDIVKPSLDDCTRLFGPGLSPAIYADHFLEKGCQIVALTMGPDGLYLATTEGDRYEIKSSQAHVVDITGAGDAFWAGFLASMLDGEDPIEAARLGQVLAEIKIGTMGPVEKFPDRSKLKKQSRAIQYNNLTGISNDSN